ncbi:hypothetical protein V6N12_057093 [Hibiscus sabdariffa]|uniref:RNase H type-1 domain-containing protein n=1 Tax=Hibiscus sabdariffa TaxID=183260 RepID=A0ABR2DCY2_9ROSI
MQREVVAASLQAIFGGNSCDGNPNTEQNCVRWLKPPEGWCKLINSDGAVARDSGFAACGGVVRNASGTWLIEYSKRVEICLVLETELWGIFEGLVAAWSIDWIIVESDCLEAVNMILNYGYLSVVPNIVHSIVEQISEQTVGTSIG